MKDRRKDSKKCYLFFIFICLQKKEITSVNDYEINETDIIAKKYDLS